MQMLIVAIYDRASGAYGQPFYSTTPSHAIRSFADAIQRREEGNIMNKHPDDFELFQLGSFDDQTGQFETHDPKQIALGKQYQTISMTTM